MVPAGESDPASGRPSDLSRDGIVSTRMKWMTAGNAPGREPTAAPRTMAVECFDRVRRASWIITARRWQQRRNSHLVRPYDPHKGLREPPRHRTASRGPSGCGRRCRCRSRPRPRWRGSMRMRCRRPRVHRVHAGWCRQLRAGVMRPRTPSYTRPTSLARAANGASYAVGSARTTTSTGGIARPAARTSSPARAYAAAFATVFAAAFVRAIAPAPPASARVRSEGRRRVRTSSRRRRLRRLRSTDEWPYLGTTNPTRACGSAEGIARTSRYSTRMRVPDRRTATRSAALVSRSLRGSPLGAGILTG